MSDSDDLFDNLDAVQLPRHPEDQHTYQADDLMEMDAREREMNQEWEIQEEQLEREQRRKKRKPERDAPMTQVPEEMMDVDEIEDYSDDGDALDDLANRAIQETQGYESPIESFSDVSPKRSSKTSSGQAPPLPAEEPKSPLIDFDSPSFDVPRSGIPRRPEPSVDSDDLLGEEPPSKRRATAPKRTKKTLAELTAEIQRLRRDPSDADLEEAILKDLADHAMWVRETLRGYFTDAGLSLIDRDLERAGRLANPMPAYLAILKSCDLLARSEPISVPDGASLLWDPHEQTFTLVRNRNLALLTFHKKVDEADIENGFSVDGQLVQVGTKTNRRNLTARAVEYHMFDAKKAIQDTAAILVDGLIARCREVQPIQSRELVGLLRRQEFLDLLGRWFWYWISSQVKLVVDPYGLTKEKAAALYAALYTSLRPDSDPENALAIQHIGMDHGMDLLFIGHPFIVAYLRHIFDFAKDATIMRTLADTLVRHWACWRKALERGEFYGSQGQGEVRMQSFVDRIMAAVFDGTVDHADLPRLEADRHAVKILVDSEGPQNLLHRLYPDAKGE